MTHDADNLERLLAERADGSLSPADRAELDRLIASREEVARSARAYARLAELLAGWRRLDAQIDWSGFSGRVSEQLAADVGAVASAQIDATLDPTLSEEIAAPPGPHYVAERQALQQVDDLVQEWAQPLSNVDWDEFKARVSAAVRDEAARPSYAHRTRLQRPTLWRRALTIGVPLAAAAALAFVFLRPRLAPVPVAPTPGEPETVIAVTVDQPGDFGRITVAFDETKPKDVAPQVPLPTGSGIAVGPSAREVSEPAEVAFLY